MGHVITLGDVLWVVVPIGGIVLVFGLVAWFISKIDLSH